MVGSQVMDVAFFRGVIHLEGEWIKWWNLEKWDHLGGRDVVYKVEDTYGLERVSSEQKIVCQVETFIRIVETGFKNCSISFSKPAQLINDFFCNLVKYTKQNCKKTSLIHHDKTRRKNKTCVYCSQLRVGFRRVYRWILILFLCKFWVRVRVLLSM